MRDRRVGSVICLAAVVFLFASTSVSRPHPELLSQFKFQNNFWVNLHLFLRSEARRREHKSTPLMPAALSGEEQKAWAEALDSYTELARLNLIFDTRLIRINNSLAELGDVATLPAGSVELGIVAALNAAAPIYRAHLWEQHRRANEEWIAKFAPMIQQHATSVTKALEAAYQVKWPAEPILVDVTCESGPNEAYTTAGPPGTAGHTVMAASKLSDADMNFETVFHEASHTVDDPIMQMLNAEARRQKLRLPDDLWHVLIFYTTGEIVKRELGKQGDPNYRPYAYRVNLYTSAGWDKMLLALEREWQPYLDGRVEFGSALHNLVRDASE